VLCDEEAFLEMVDDVMSFRVLKLDKDIGEERALYEFIRNCFVSLSNAMFFYSMFCLSFLRENLFEAFDSSAHCELELA